MWQGGVKCPPIEKIEKSSQLSQTTLSLEGFFYESD